MTVIGCFLLTVLTWEVDGGVDGCAGRNRGVDQVRVLQAEPGSKGSWVGAPKCNPLAVGQASRGCSDRAEVSEIGQSLTTTEETQIYCAQIPDNTQHNNLSVTEGIFKYGWMDGWIAGWIK